MESTSLPVFYLTPKRVPPPPPNSPPPSRPPPPPPEPRDDRQHYELGEECIFEMELY